MTAEQTTPEDGQATTTDQAPAATTDPAEQSSSAELQERIAQLEKELNDYKDSYLRAMADYKNFKRRTDQERADLIRNASAGLLLKLLPIVDDLERATQSVTAEIEQTPWYSGFKLIPQKLAALLESEGVTAIEAFGGILTPTRHEAVIYEAADGQADKVIADLQKGYMLRDRVLRPSMVKVGQG